MNDDKEFPSLNDEPFKQQMGWVCISGLSSVGRWSANQVCVGYLIVRVPIQVYLLPLLRSYTFCFTFAPSYSYSSWRLHYFVNFSKQNQWHTLQKPLWSPILKQKFPIPAYLRPMKLLRLNTLVLPVGHRIRMQPLFRPSFIFPSIRIPVASPLAPIMVSEYSIATRSARYFGGILVTVVELD